MRKSLRAKKRIIADKHRKQLVKNKQTIEDIFTLQHYVKVLPKCYRNVMWKGSVQNYKSKCIEKIYRSYREIRSGKYPVPVSSHNTIIYERGKKRIITPIHIHDRVMQKVFCDYCLVPELSRHLIYDNGASLRGKGSSFTRKRVNRHLAEAVKEYGSDFYILTYDIKSFFDSVPHSTCRKILNKYFSDKRIVDLAMHIIQSPYRDKGRHNGMCLGSQISQIMALAVLNDLDHYIKDCKGMRYYDRYMDDGVIFAKTKEELKELYKGMKVVAESLGMPFNDKKTHIIKSRKGFTFMKVKYRVSPSGKVIRRLVRSGITRERKKLKSLSNLIDSGKIPYQCAKDSILSWKDHARIAQSYITQKQMMKLYHTLFYQYERR